jgi:anion-transporting  ArsA/GET3 family ATPase
MTESAAQSSAQGLLPLVHAKRILVVVGSGGVGKTSTAAALGLLAARGGRRTLVMTIDPARRLASSLGLRDLDHEQRRVPAEKLTPVGVPPDTLYAMMLDMKHAFDEMVQRYAPTPETARRLLQSRIYQQLSSRLAGSQEYAAMEALHALWKSQTYQLLVLDTPPTANALDFLDAPQKMVEAVESPALHLFVSAYRKAGRLSLNVLNFSAAYVVRRLARFTGGDFLDDIAAFLAELSTLLGGMHERAAQVTELLSRPEIGFVVVTGPDPRAVDEAIALHDRLAGAKMTPGAFIVNKVHPLLPVELSLEQLMPKLADAMPSPARLADVLLRSHSQMQALAAEDARQIGRLREHIAEAASQLVQVPLFDEDIFDVGGLMRLGEYLA